VDALLGALSALSAMESVPSVQEMLDWVRRPATQQRRAGSLHDAKDRWRAAFGDRWETRALDNGAVYEITGQPPEPRLPRVTMSRSDQALHDSMTWQFIRSGAMGALAPSLVKQAAAAGFTPVIHTSACISKNKPGQGPYGSALHPDGDMLAAQMAGDSAAETEIRRRTRMITNFKNGVNMVTNSRKYHVGRATDIRPMLRRGMAQACVDVEDAYHSVLLAEYFRALMGVQITSPEVAAWAKSQGATALCMFANQFGATNAGLVFTTFVELAIRIPRSFGVALSTITDDIWVGAAATATASAEKACRAHTSMVLLTMRFFNFKFNAEKLELVPEIQRVFGGLIADTDRFTQGITAARIKKARGVWISILIKAKGKMPISLRSWSQASGMAISMWDGVPAIRTFAHGLTNLVATATSRAQKKGRRVTRSSSAGQGRVAYRIADYETVVPPTIAAVLALEWLCSPSLDEWNGFPVHPWNTGRTVVCDADRYSYGFSAFKGTMSGSASARMPDVRTRYLSEVQQSPYSSRTELTALVLSSIEDMTENNVTDTDYEGFTDSKCTAATMNKGGSSSAEMNKILIDLEWWQTLRSRRNRLRATWIPGTSMISNGVDGGSRPSKMNPAELCLRQTMFQRLRSFYALTEGQPAVDLFSSPASPQLCPVWVSRTAAKGAIAVNAMHQDWIGLAQKYGHPLYAFPPMGTRSLLEFLRKAEAERVWLIFVAPWDHTRLFCQQALILADGPPLLFHLSEENLAHPEPRLATKWFRQSADRRLISQQNVWACWSLFGKIGDSISQADTSVARRNARARFEVWQRRASQSTIPLSDRGFTGVATQILTSVYRLTSG